MPTCWCHRKIKKKTSSQINSGCVASFERSEETATRICGKSHNPAGGVPSDVVLRLAGVRRCHAAVTTGGGGNRGNDTRTNGKLVFYPVSLFFCGGGECVGILIFLFVNWDGMAFNQ